MTVMARRDLLKAMAGTAVATGVSFRRGPILLAQSLPPLPIYGHPQKTAYANQDEWPILEAQSHWSDLNVNATPGIPSHTHVGMTFPLYALTPLVPFTVPFSVTLFNTAGSITGFGGMRIKSVTLDNGARLPIVGDPNGLVTRTGVVTFEPTNAPPRGFMAYMLYAVTAFTNGDRMSTWLRLPRYSLIDPTAPETGSNNILNARCILGDAGDPQPGRWGEQFTEVKQMLPVLGPLTPELPFPVLGSLYNYAPVRFSLPAGIAELWLDPDLHNGNPGTLLTRVIGPNSSTSETGLPYSFPAGIADGVHKVMYMWRRPNFSGDKELTSNLVFSITVGSSEPPPPSPCTSGATGEVSVSDKLYRVTVTEACVPSVVGPL